MMTITNGTVELERSVRPADFETRRVRVSLSYTVDDGADPAAITAAVGDMAFAEIWRQLRRSETARPAASPKEDHQQEHVVAPDPAVPPVEEDAPTITDAHLVAAVTKARGRKISPEQIKGVRDSFVEQVGMSMTTLPQEKRPAFVAALEALSP